MKSNLYFRGCEVAIRAQADGTVALTITGEGANNRASVILGADAANLIGSELERAALYVERVKRNAERVAAFATTEQGANYAAKYRAKGADHAGA